VSAVARPSGYIFLLCRSETISIVEQIIPPEQFLQSCWPARGTMKSAFLYFIAFILVVIFCSNSFAAEHRVVRVGAFNYYPAIFKDTDGQIKGFYVDALDDIAKRENIAFEYVYGSWNEGLERIKSGEVDLLTSVAFTAERASYLDYGKTPLLTVWGELYTVPGSEVDNIRHVQGKRIAVMKGDFNGKYFYDLVGKFNISCEFVEMPEFEDVFKAIAAKTVDAGVVNSTFGVAKQNEYSLRSTGVVFNPFDIFFAVAKGKNSDLLSLLDRNLDSWRNQENSVFNQARQKWSYGNVGKVAVVPAWLRNSAVVLATLVFLSAFFIATLKNQVQKATADILESKAVLRESEATLRSYIENSPAGIFVADENGKYIEVNPAACLMTGYGREELLKMTLLDIVSPENVELNIQKFSQLKQTGCLKFEIEFLHKNGSQRWMMLSAVKLSDVRYMGFATDISETKKSEREKALLEMQLQQAQKLESVGRLAGGVAHDFNNMLGVIIGHADMALMGMPQSAPLYSDLIAIRSAAERSADLTRQLLAFARKQTIVPKVMDLNETVEGMLKMLQRLIGEDITLNWKPEENLWKITVDPSQVDQILANLCVNARDSIADTGSITIETKNVSAFEEFKSYHADFEPGEYVCLSVSDDGCGMDKDTQQHIFEPFFTTKGVGEGTGLGLATVYGAVKQNNGYVNVYSEPGVGTTFSIYFPRSLRDQESVQEQVATAIPLGGREMVLIVEDESAILRMTALMLEKQGYTVLQANSSEEAMVLAAEHAAEIRLLITDVIMPENNGRELSERLTRLYPGIRTIYMSGYTADLIARRGVIESNFAYIQKPFSARELAAKVREVLDRQ
jgi:two-component system, cell cycle sensor histidine kinase and response regulator CckA